MADVRLGDAVTQGGLSRRIVAVLVVEFLLVVGGLTTAVLLAHNSSTQSGPIGALVGSNSKATAVDQANAVSVARQFALNSDAFAPADLKGYLANLMPLLTTKAQADLTNQYAQFNQVAGSVLSQVTQDSQAAAIPSVGEIEFAALSTYTGSAGPTGSTATVIVAHDVLYGGVTSAQCATKPDYCQSKRWSVSLRKMNGVWLVDTFNPNA